MCRNGGIFILGDVTGLRVAYAVGDPANVNAVREAGDRVLPLLETYGAYLQQLDPGFELPRGVVFLDRAAGTEVLSTYPLPAWTNTDSKLVYLDPVPEDWAAIFGDILRDHVPEDAWAVAREDFATLDAAYVASIAGHEYTHHLTAFSEEAPGAEWFEEGFCFALARRELLSEARGRRVAEVEQALVDAARGRNTSPLVEAFTVPGLQESVLTYYRATASVTRLLETHAGGDARRLLSWYATWHGAASGEPLHAFLARTLDLDAAQQRDLFVS